jgi:hypothetical protein
MPPARASIDHLAPRRGFSNPRASSLSMTADNALDRAREVTHEQGGLDVSAGASAA